MFILAEIGDYRILNFHSEDLWFLISISLKSVMFAYRHSSDYLVISWDDWSFHRISFSAWRDLFSPFDTKTYLIRREAIQIIHRPINHFCYEYIYLWKQWQNQMPLMGLKIICHLSKQVDCNKGDTNRLPYCNSNNNLHPHLLVFWEIVAFSIVSIRLELLYGQIDLPPLRPGDCREVWKKWHFLLSNVPIRFWMQLPSICLRVVHHCIS